jgi:hypothetical protein
MSQGAIVSRRSRRVVSSALVVAAAWGASSLSGCSNRQEPAPLSLSAGDPQQARIERGEYLVTVLSCNDCHTPFKMGDHGPEPDMSRMLSGHPQEIGALTQPELKEPWIWAGTGTNTAFAGPWGITYAFNLTPDNHTGLGIWTEEMFIKAIRTGKHFGEARQIQPPMPWPWFAKLTDEDLKSVYAYLRSIPPVQNMVPDYQPPPKASPASAPQ